MWITRWMLWGSFIKYSHKYFCLNESLHDTSSIIDGARHYLWHISIEDAILSNSISRTTQYSAMPCQERRNTQQPHAKNDAILRNPMPRTTQYSEIPCQERRNTQKYHVKIKNDALLSTTIPRMTQYSAKNDVILRNPMSRTTENSTIPCQERCNTQQSHATNECGWLLSPLDGLVRCWLIFDNAETARKI